MAYEIPPEIEYKERIIFGLTFQQLAYAILFGLILLAIFKLSLPLTTSLILSSIPFTLAIGFMFLDLKQHLTNILTHFKFTKAEQGTKAMKKFLKIKQIKDSLINNKISIIKLESINFMIKTEESKEAILSNFRKFLNSISFNVQIIITSEDLDLTPHFNHLEKTTKLKELFNNYKKFIEKQILTNATKNRSFYILITENSNITIETNIVMDSLSFLSPKRLTTKEILLFLKNYFKNTPQNKIKDTLEYLIAPNNISSKIDHLKINNQYSRIIAAKGYPNFVESGFLDKLISGKEDYDISIHINPYPIELTLIKVNKELQKQNADLHTDQSKGIYNPSLEIKYKATKKILEDLYKGTQKLFDVSLYINCKANTKADLDFLSKKVESDLNASMIQPHLPA